MGEGVSSPLWGEGWVRGFLSLSDSGEWGEGAG